MVFEALNPTVAVTIIAAIILLVINVFYKFLVNQDKAAALKERTKFLTEESKKYKDKPEKQKEYMSEMMSCQRDMMKMNMKPMLVSLIVVAIALPFLASSYYDIAVSIDSKEIIIDNQNYAMSLSDGIISVGDKQCQLPCALAIDNKAWHFSESAGKIKSYSIVATMPFNVPFLGNQWGWILWYILVSIPLAIIIRAAYGIRV